MITAILVLSIVGAVRSWQESCEDHSAATAFEGACLLFAAIAILAIIKLCV